MWYIPHPSLPLAVCVWWVWQGGIGKVVKVLRELYPGREIWLYWILFQNSKTVVFKASSFRGSSTICLTIQLSRTTHGRYGTFNIQHSIWGNIEHSCDAKILKKNIQCTIYISLCVRTWVCVLGLDGRVCWVFASVERTELYCVYISMINFTRVLFHHTFQPCPPPLLDLTLVSAHKFVSNECHLVSSVDHMVVLTKIHTEHVRSSKTLWVSW